MGLRREPQPRCDVMPSRSSAAISAAVVRLSRRGSGLGAGEAAIISDTLRLEKGRPPAGPRRMCRSSRTAGLRLARRARPDRVAIVHEGDEITRGELDRRSNRLARDYARRGVGAATS